MEILPLSVDQAFQTSARRETTQTRGIRPVFICGCQLPSTASEPLDSLRKEVIPERLEFRSSALIIPYGILQCSFSIFYDHAEICWAKQTLLDNIQHKFNLLYS